MKPMNLYTADTTTGDTKFHTENTTTNNKPIVIEGSYCLRTDFRSIYTKKLFLTVDASTQKQRLIKRVGNVNFQKFQELWIPKENAYFEHFHIQEIADIVLSSQQLLADIVLSSQ